MPGEHAVQRRQHDRIGEKPPQPPGGAGSEYLLHATSEASQHSWYRDELCKSLLLILILLLQHTNASVL